jgi:GTP-binding protein EngB required for normal cell division
MKQSLQTFHEISTSLQDVQLVKQIEQLQKMIEMKDVCVPLIGQFSAGKSNLLNNLFGRKILPTMSSETTAFSTFISYGSEEHTYLLTKSGVRYDISLDDLLHLSQRTLMMKQSLAEMLNLPVAEGDIDAVYVQLTHPLLQDGLVFVDTPGLNTLIQTHENRTQALLPRANAIIYVLGKSLTDSDLTIIRQIDRLGIEMFFVRTKLDEVKASEGEIVQDVLLKDTQHLRNVLGKDPIMFGISNDTNFLSIAEWRARMNALYNYLFNHLSSKASELKEQSMTSRMLLIANQLQSKLENKKNHLEELMKIDINVLDEQVKELERQISILKRKMKSQYEQRIAQFEDVEQQIYVDVKQAYEKTKKRFENHLCGLATVDSIQDKSEQIAELLIGEASNGANRILKDSVDQFIVTITNDSNQILADVERHIESNQASSLQLNIEVPSIEEVFDDVEYIEEKLKMVESIHENEDLKQRLGQLQQERGKIEEEMVAVTQQKNEVEMERRVLGGYQPQYQVEQANAASNILGKIGMGLDMALLFLPSTAVAKGATIVAKGATTLSNATKVAKVAKQSAQIAEKASKTAKVFDRVKDALYIAKNIQEKGRNNEIVKETPGLLDLVTVEFWFRKAGELLDGPPKHVEDEDYRNHFLAAEHEIHTKYEAVKMEELSRLQQLNLIQSREQRIKKELEIDERNKQRLQQDLQREKDRLLQEAKHKQVDTYREALIKQFNEAIDGLLTQQHKFIAEFLTSFREKLPTSLSMRLQQEINIYHQQLQQAIETMQSEEKEAQQTEQQLSAQIKLIQDYIQKATVVMN